MIKSWLGINPDYALKYLALRSELPHALLGVLIALAAALAGYLYYREKLLSPARRIFLALLRTLALGLLLAILFEPVMGLEKRVVVRRNLLVLVDRSESMSIADQRNEPGDVADAALALGKTPFVLPAAQEALTAAQRATRSALDLLKQSQWDDARDAQREAAGSLTAALAEIDAAAASPGQAQTQIQAPPRPQARERAARLAPLVRALARRQQALDGKAEELQKQGLPVDADRCSELREAQEAVGRDLDQLAADFTAESLAQSAGLPGDAVSAPRIELARGLLNQTQFRVLDRAARRFDVHYFFFGEKLEEVAARTGATNPLLSALPTDKATRGAEHIREAVARYSGQPIAGVILLTDGAMNDESLDPLSVATALREQNIPLYPVGIGLPKPRDVGLDPRTLIVQDTFFPKDKITARFQVSSHGYEGVASEARILLDGQEVGKSPVQLGEEPRNVEISFQVPEGKRGPARLEVIVPPQPGEITTANNRLERQVKIVDQKIKVLYVEGNPRWEYRYLRVLLLRDPRLDVKFLMTRGDEELPASSPQYLARYPERAADAFSYDLVILGDVPAWYFSRAQLERMVQLVHDRGGSLLMLAGDRFAPASYVDTPIADLLPVKISSDSVPINPLEYPAVTAEGRHSFTQLETSDEATDAIWSLVRPLYRLPRIEERKTDEKVLAELPAGRGRSERYPLIAWRYAGTGKAMYVGADQLWRMRFKLGDQYHARFWGQAIQFLALSRLLGENKRVNLQADRTELQPGQRVEISACVLDPSFQPVKANEYLVRVERTMVGVPPPADGKSGRKSAVQPAVKPADNAAADSFDVSLAPVSGSPGRYQGFCTIGGEGRYVIKALADDPRISNSVDLLVASARREQQEPAMQEAMLRKMAELSGGRYLTIREWPALGGLLEGRERVLIDPKEEDLWDNWPVYALFLACVSGEWFIRRRSRLV